MVERIGQFLTLSDLISSVQVCRAWNKILTPVLWHTVNTNSQPWSYIIKQEPSGERTREEIEICVKSLFEKHGHHIRNLESNWRVVLEAASLGGTGHRNLTSLVLGNFYQRYRTPSTVLVDLNDLQLCNQKSWRRYVIGRFWNLVRQNPGLVRLRLPRLGVMNDESPEYTIDSLSMLRNLKDLDLDGMLLDVGLLLSVVPQLERLRVIMLWNFTPLLQDYSSLRRL
ncbi:hypothetical protein K457DRAFT_120595 [Linnemannia elongata AG-77]|uniref:F-box domain-containing protein n=1 Tax=Linnemannia elongata AG-77 TaxID=1314771 RepID=A0A197KF71_9FUNG|nr:hypothetical protein K457DRAFT_120595 [Linnemannia elongata AG-77]